MDNDFIENLRRKGTITSVSRNTKLAYGVTLNLFTKWLDGREVTLELAQQWLELLLKDGKKPTTVSRYGNALRKYLQYKGIKYKGIDGEELLLLPSIKAPQHIGSDQFFELSEIQKLLKAARSPLETAVIVVLTETGLRISEFLGLRKEDIDLKNGFLFAHREKTGQDGWIPLGAKAQEAIKEYLKWRTPPGDVLFPYKYQAVRYWLRKVAKQAGIKKPFKLHAFRHTAGAIRHQQGTKLEDIATLLGHTDLKTTRRYTTVKSSELKERIKEIL